MVKVVLIKASVQSRFPDGKRDYDTGLDLQYYMAVHSGVMRLSLLAVVQAWREPLTGSR
jgi:hypothetical protein